MPYSDEELARLDTKTQEILYQEGLRMNREINQQVENIDIYKDTVEELNAYPTALVHSNGLYKPGSYCPETQIPNGANNPAQSLDVYVGSEVFTMLETSHQSRICPNCSSKNLIPKPVSSQVNRIDGKEFKRLPCQALGA